MMWELHCTALHTCAHLSLPDIDSDEEEMENYHLEPQDVPAPYEAVPAKDPDLRAQPKKSALKMKSSRGGKVSITASSLVRPIVTAVPPTIAEADSPAPSGSPQLTVPRKVILPPKQINFQ